MSLYTPAADPADNVTLRAVWARGGAKPCEIKFMRDNSAWIMRNTAVNRARYDANFDHSPNPPTNREEALERAGATFYPRWYQCEVLRFRDDTWTKATLMALSQLPRTRENARLALLELQENPCGMDADRLQEEYKSLAFVQGEIKRNEEGETN